MHSTEKAPAGATEKSTLTKHFFRPVQGLNNIGNQTHGFTVGYYLTVAPWLPKPLPCPLPSARRAVFAGNFFTAAGRLNYSRQIYCTGLKSNS